MSITNFLSKIKLTFLKVHQAGKLDDNFLIDNAYPLKRDLRMNHEDNIQELFDIQYNLLYQKINTWSGKDVPDIFTLLVIMSAMSGPVLVKNIGRITDMLNAYWRTTDTYFVKLVKLLDTIQLIYLYEFDKYELDIESYLSNILLRLTQFNLSNDDQQQIMSLYSKKSLRLKLLKYMPYLIRSDTFIMDYSNEYYGYSEYHLIIKELISNLSDNRRDLVDKLFIGALTADVYPTEVTRMGYAYLYFYQLNDYKTDLLIPYIPYFTTYLSKNFLLGVLSITSTDGLKRLLLRNTDALERERILYHMGLRNKLSK